MWKEARIGVDALCRGDRKQPIRIDVYDYSKKGIFWPWDRVKRPWPISW